MKTNGNDDMKNERETHYAIGIIGQENPISIGENFFHSWCGTRFMDGKPYNGRIYFLFSEDEVSPDQMCMHWEESTGEWIKMKYSEHVKALA